MSGISDNVVKVMGRLDGYEIMWWLGVGGCRPAVGIIGALYQRSKR
jgi:hypothetical protein